MVMIAAEKRRSQRREKAMEDIDITLLSESCPTIISSIIAAELGGTPV
jgi:hypothetical protein